MASHAIIGPRRLSLHAVVATMYRSEAGPGLGPDEDSICPTSRKTCSSQERQTDKIGIREAERTRIGKAVLQLYGEYRSGGWGLGGTDHLLLAVQYVHIRRKKKIQWSGSRQDWRFTKDHAEVCSDPSSFRRESAVVPNQT